MYAIIRTGGKQYTVKPGDVVQIEKLEQPLGTEFDLNEILMIGGETTVIGQPLVKNAKVTVVVTKQAKTRKVIVFKKKRRQGYRKTQGHRQDFTEIFVKAITSPDGKVAKTEEKPNVVDMIAKRADQVQAKQEAKEQALQARKTGEVVEKKAPAKKAVKKTAKKAGVKKAGKKAGPKKTAKKTAKKAK